MALVISSEFVLAPAVAEPPLSYPRILYDDVWFGSTITATTEDTDAAAANVADGLTWDYWRPTELPASVTATLSVADTVNYALIAAHDFGTNEVAVDLEYYDGSWHTITSFLPGTDRVLAVFFDDVIGTAFRLSLSGENSPEQIPSVGIVMMGQALVMERGLILDHRPITYARRTVVRPQISDGGKLLGRSIQRHGVATKLDFQHLTAAWIRNNFEPFILHARTRPFGWVWQPEAYPAEVALLWTPSGSEDIHPEYKGLPTRMNVSFNVEGIVE
jgi:hypothetical protein